MKFEDNRLNRIKKEYREILNKYHSDLNLNQPNEKYSRPRVQINRYYQIRIRYLKEGKKKYKDSQGFQDHQSGQNNFCLTKDQSYSVYRQGVNHYKQIQPSRWVSLGSLEDLFFNNRRIKSYEDQKRIFDKIFVNFHKAITQFFLVITEYPRSPWVIDAKKKVLNLGRLLQKYRKIRESIDKELN